MASTIRELIMAQVKTLMETITTANNYETDVGDNIFEWREYPLEISESPAIVIRDTEESFTFPHPESFDVALTIELVIFAADTNVPANLRKIIGDITKALGVDETLGGYVQHIEPVDSSMVLEHQENVIGDVIYTFIVRYRIGAFDPYTLNKA